jgi:hypothetical protein
VYNDITSARFVGYKPLIFLPQLAVVSRGFNAKATSVELVLEKSALAGR